VLVTTHREIKREHAPRLATSEQNRPSTNPRSSSMQSAPTVAGDLEDITTRIGGERGGESGGESGRTF